MQRRIHEKGGRQRNHFYHGYASGWSNADGRFIGAGVAPSNSKAVGASPSTPHSRLWQDIFPISEANLPRQWFYFWYGASMWGEADLYGMKGLKILPEGLPSEGEQWLYRGIGSAFNGYWTYRQEEENYLKELLENVPPLHHPDIFWGMGWGLRENFFEDPVRTRDWINRLPAAFRASATEGMKAFEGWYHLQP